MEKQVPLAPYALAFLGDGVYGICEIIREDGMEAEGVDQSELSGQVES